MAKSFSAQVSNWTRQTIERTNAVYRTAIDLTVQDMLKTKEDSGTLPIDTGNLRRSFLLSTTSRVTLGAPDQEYAAQDTALALTGVKFGDTVYGGFQARYAARQNYGGGGITGNYFFDLALAKWPQFVKQAENQIFTRVNSR